MKHAKFKIRAIGTQNKDLPNEEQFEIKLNENPSKDPSTKLQDILSELRKLIQESKSKALNPIEYEVRDRHVSVDSDRFVEGKYNSDEIETWIGEVCRDVMSSAFHYYLTEAMNYDQTKVYCCQGILKNISQFIEKNNTDITPEFYSIVDRILRKNVLPYLGLKYPASVSNEVNIKLNKVFKEINNMEVVTNDFFYNSDITLEYRESGVYNDLIMRVINKIIRVADSNAASEGESDSMTNFQDFEEFMGDLFEKVYDQQWMMKGKKNSAKVKPSEEQKEGQVDEQEREKYKEQVKEYTHYLIGRKIPESVQEFDEFEVKSGFVNIKSPTILRIITKWCEELWEKFENENYYTDRTEGITMLKGKQINIAYPSIKKILKYQMKIEKEKIEEYMKKIQLNNYTQQQSIMNLQQLSKKAPYINKHERICGKFSMKVVKNLENYIVVYLNRLIHGLMTVSKNAFKQMKAKPSWPYPPNLLSFKVGDLLRCKCVSKEREILSIFEQMQKISENNPEKLKIIRIKNRLKLGTNDILINVRFNNCLTAQIQLKALSKASQSKFSSCSYNFSHLIYEMQRSYFGPISEMCSIWVNLDSRVNIFKKLIAEESPHSQLEQLKDSYCFRNFKDHSLQAIDNTPFICSECSKSYSNNNYVIPHYGCIKCKYWKCALCSIKEKEGTDLIELVIEDQQIRAGCYPLRRKVDIPVFFIQISIESKLKEVFFFKKLEVFQKVYLFKIVNNDSFQLFKVLSTEKSQRLFLQANLIFELETPAAKELPKIYYEVAVKQFILREYVKDCYKYEKETLSLNSLKQFDIKEEDFAQMLQGSKQQKKSIKYIEISINNLSSLEFISPDFKNMQFLNINTNSITNLQHLASFTKLHTLFATANKIQEFPVKICFLNLKYLSLYKNGLKKLPKQFCNLKHLQVLRVSDNELTELPEGFGQLQNLKYLYCNRNELTNIDNLTCSRLKFLDMAQNNVTELPESLETLSNLTFFDLNYNKISTIYTNFTKLKKLKEINLSQNEFNQFPSKIFNTPELNNLNMSKMTLSKIDMRGGQLPAIQEVNFENNQIEDIYGLECLKNAVSLNLCFNKLSQFPSDIFKLVNLRKLYLNQNLLSELSPIIGKLSRLKQLSLFSNRLVSFPPEFFKLKLQVLDFGKNNFSVLPVELMSMRSLKDLKFQHNAIDKIPPSIVNLRSLQTLGISHNMIVELPSQMIILRKLKNLTFEGLPVTHLSTILLKFNSTFSGMKIKTLPENIPKITNVETLMLNRNQIARIPYSISQLVNIKSLNLDQNQLTQICDGIFELANLSYLSMASNQIATINDKFHKLTDLKTLLLSNNKIESIPDSLDYLIKSGLMFKFNSNPITYIPESILRYSLPFVDALKLELNTYKLNKLPDLPYASKHRSLNISGNRFQQIPNTILQCSQLRQLDLSSNLIKDISHTTFDLPMLTNLILKQNQIEEIPNSFEMMRQLKFLYLQKNPIKRISQGLKETHLNTLGIDLICFENLARTNSLQYINTSKIQFSQTSIQKLPEQFWNIGHLQQLNLTGHNLKALPESMGKLKSLVKLQINCKPFETLPNSIGALSNLQEIKIVNCQMTALPEGFWMLSKLSRIEIYKTKLCEISERIGELQNLKLLSVKQNNLTKLPRSITKLTNLATLFFENNKITELPPGISGCIGLIGLFGSNNQIKIIPKELEKLSKILANTVALEENPIQKIECPQFLRIKGNLQTKNLLKEQNTTSVIHD